MALSVDINTRSEIELLWRVVKAAQNEVLAQGYHSSDMARALEALCGEFWFEVTMPSKASRCKYSVTTELDDGPWTQQCIHSPHNSSIEHRLERWT